MSSDFDHFQLNLLSLMSIFFSKFSDQLFLFLFSEYSWDNNFEFLKGTGKKVVLFPCDAYKHDLQSSPQFRENVECRNLQVASCDALSPNIYCINIFNTPPYSDNFFHSSVLSISLHKKSID